MKKILYVLIPIVAAFVIFWILSNNKKKSETTTAYTINKMDILKSEVPQSLEEVKLLEQEFNNVDTETMPASIKSGEVITLGMTNNAGIVVRIPKEYLNKDGEYQEKDIERIRLPKCKPLLKKGATTTFKFDGLDFFIKNNKVVGLKGISLSKTALEIITEKVLLLDKISTYCCESKNVLFQLKPVNYAAIDKIDAQYFETVRIITQMTSEIKDLASKKDANVKIGELAQSTKLPDTNSIRAMAVPVLK